MEGMCGTERDQWVPMKKRTQWHEYVIHHGMKMYEACDSHSLNQIKHPFVKS